MPATSSRFHIHLICFIFAYYSTSIDFTLSLIKPISAADKLYFLQRRASISSTERFQSISDRSLKSCCGTNFHFSG